MIIESDNLIQNDVTDAEENKRIPLSEQAYTQIRHKIVSLQLPPGSIVNESQLQKELGLGRTPIREALLRLSLERLVTRVPRRGIFVTDIHITDLQRLFEMRLELESLAARLAAQRGSDQHWQRMESILASLPADDLEALIARDEQFHRVLYEAADNKFLQDTLTTLYALSMRLWYFFLFKIGNMKQVILEHEMIIEALKNRDDDRAAELLEKHIREFQERIQTAMLDGGSSSSS